jgi:hypothetical protein
MDMCRRCWTPTLRGATPVSAFPMTALFLIETVRRIEGYEAMQNAGEGVCALASVFA